MTQPFPEPTLSADSRAEVLVRYLDYFRSRVIERIEQLPELELRRSRLPSGWTPLELAKHLTFVEMRWLEWGFEGRSVENPWADTRDGRWFVPESESRAELVEGLRRQGRAIAGHRRKCAARPGRQTRPALGWRRAADPRAHPPSPHPGVRPPPRSPRHRERALGRFRRGVTGPPRHRLTVRNEESAGPGERLVEVTQDAWPRVAVVLRRLLIGESTVREAKTGP